MTASKLLHSFSNQSVLSTERSDTPKVIERYLKGKNLDMKPTSLKILITSACILISFTANAGLDCSNINKSIELDSSLERLVQKMRDADDRTAWESTVETQRQITRLTIELAVQPFFDEVLSQQGSSDLGKWLGVEDGDGHRKEFVDDFVKVCQKNGKDGFYDALKATVAMAKARIYCHAKPQEEQSPCKSVMSQYMGISLQ